MSLADDLVCVICGTPWPPYANVCEGTLDDGRPCQGFCTWGPAKGAQPSSWMRVKGRWLPKPPPKEVGDGDRADSE